MPSDLLHQRVEPPYPQVGPKIPWKAMATGLGVGALGIGAGYIGGGALTKALSELEPGHRAVDWFLSLTPARQKMYSAAIGGIAGGVGGMALLGRTAALGTHLEQASDEVNRPAPPKEGAALVHEAYRAVLGP